MTTLLLGALGGLLLGFIMHLIDMRGQTRSLVVVALCGSISSAEALLRETVEILERSKKPYRSYNVCRGLVFKDRGFVCVTESSVKDAVSQFKDAIVQCQEFRQQCLEYRNDSSNKGDQDRPDPFPVSRVKAHKETR